MMHLKLLAFLLVAALQFGNHSGDLHIYSEGQILEMTVEIANTPVRRSLGLMFRDELPEDHGMIFLFPEEIDASFWMKNTRIPLSIAFFSAEGKILKIMDMDPCTQDPCPKYSPGVFYRGALEVNQGWFSRHGVKEGDYLSLT